MNTFYIVTNHTKDKDGKTTEYIRQYLTQRGCTCAEEITQDVECIIVLGGDGTVLRAATDNLGKDIPLIGVNLGTLGYLAEVDRESINTALDKLIGGQFEIESRMMLTGTPFINGNNRCSVTALNDIVINRKGSLHVIFYKIYVNGHLLNTYNADGLIVATPTGSTAYNLSAGGPIVEPKARLVVLTPVCSHNPMNNRSIIISEEDVIDIVIGENKEGEEQEIEASFDGHCPVSLKTGDSVRIICSDQVTKIIKLSKVSFLETLHKKMSGM